MSKGGLSHLDAQVQKKINNFVEDIKKIGHNNLISIILYGDVTTENFNPYISHINTLITLKKIDTSFLTEYAKLRKRYSLMASPLIFTPQLIQTSYDVFPIEFLSIKDSYIVLYGDDVLRDMDINFEDLRTEIEQQVKRQLLRSLNEFIYSLDRKADLEHLLTTSLISFVPLFKNILRLIRREHPVEGALFKEFCKEMELDERPFFEIWEIKIGRKRHTKKELINLFGDFIKEIEKFILKLEDLKINPI